MVAENVSPPWVCFAEKRNCNDYILKLEGKNVVSFKIRK